MAPTRRRLSRRVVKTTFQECFEYDIPGFRNTDIKRVTTPVIRHHSRTSLIKSKWKSSPLHVSSPTTSKNAKDTPEKNARQVVLKPKEEIVSKIVKVSSDKTARQVALKPKGVENKDESKNFAEKVNDNIHKPETPKTNNEMRSSVATRRKINSAFMGSDYKRFKTKTKINSNKSPEKEKPIEGNNQSKEATQPTTELATNASAPGIDLVSKNWQPVVHLKKLSVGESKALAYPEKSKRISSIRQHVRRTASRTPDLATRLKNALKDPMAEKEDDECRSSVNEMTSRILGDEVLKRSPTTEIEPNSSSHVQQSTEDYVRRGRRNLKTSAVEVFREDKLHKQHESDSALEDWPESSSEASDDLEFRENLNEIESLSTLNDWTGPNVSVIVHWQKQLNCIIRELKSSFDGLKSIIKEKNSLISALKFKLDNVNDSDCHKILNSILEDYDSNDPKNPATVIINSILEYPNIKG